MNRLIEPGLMQAAQDEAPVSAPSRPWPLGLHRTLAGLNVAVWAPDATAVWLCLFDAEGNRELERIAVSAFTDGVWHVLLPHEGGRDLIYGFRVEGPWDPCQGWRHNPAKVLLDPYAREIVGDYLGDVSEHVGHLGCDERLPDAHDNAAHALKGRWRAAAPIGDGVGRRHVEWESTVLYEAHVKGATRLHPDVPAHLRGTYLGLSHPAMLAHWRRLGVTTLSLLPIHAHVDEARLQRMGLSNYWGYNTVAFFAPHPGYATRPDRALDEVCAMVRELHAAGLEVVLDVVFNHTAESDEWGPEFHYRGMANRQAYRLVPGQESRYVNWSGCGNTLNLAEPRIVQMVMDSLRYWVEEVGVDGFRFDLAPVLGRDADGRFDRRNAFFAALQADPVLSRVKLIAEPWDLGPDGYRLGGFPPGWREWNDQFRDGMRSWWLRGAGDRAQFAQRFAASSEQFRHSGRAPTASVNFITAHDGFTLRDLVTYNHKHNLANGEINRDGHHHNNSWNCGVEGPTADPDVLFLRTRLQRALLAMLLLSQGTPMLLGGDELGHTQSGNNNAYCQDNPVTWLDWTQADPSMMEWVSGLVALRRECAALRQGTWLTGHTDRQGCTDVVWLHPEGRSMTEADWHTGRGDHAMAVMLCARGQTALLLINPDEDDRRFLWPSLAAATRWQRRACSAQGAFTPEFSAATDAVACPSRTVQVWFPCVLPESAS